VDISPPTYEEELLRDALELGDAAEVTFISREPLGAGSVAGFELAGPGGTPFTYFVDTSRRAVATETGLVAGDPAAPEGRVWLHPADPHLPALAPVAFADAARTLLDRLGLSPVGAPSIVAYRPGRRAVLRIPVADGVQWLKVVPPARVERIVGTHQTLAEHGIPLPDLRGWSPEGLLVLDDARGTPAAAAPWEPEALVDEADRLRAALSGVPLRVRARTHLDRHLDWYAERLRGVLAPEGVAVVDAVEREARARWGGADEVTVHGDLHFGQLFLDEQQRVSAVIDVDTTGIGATVDDSAAFISHAIASAVLSTPPHDERVWELARAALRRWGTADGIRARTATHLLGQALGAQEGGHEERAERMLRAAASVVAGDHTLGAAL